MGAVRIGFDVSALDPGFKEHAQRGIGRYVRELKQYFDKTFPSQESESVSLGYFSHTDFKAGALLDGLVACAPLGRETLRQQIIYPLKLGAGIDLGFDVMHFPAQMDAPSWSPMPYLITVLDLIPIVCRDLYDTPGASWRFKLARWLELRAIKNARQVMVISENTGNDVHRLLGVPWERISVTPLGVSEGFFRDIDPQEVVDLRARLGIRSSPTVLYVGGIDQRKNWRYMFEVMAQLRERCLASGQPVPHLVVAGRIDRDKQYPQLLSEITRLKIEDLVTQVGFVSDQDLPILYRACNVFFFPSLYEGFGLPPLEALATGTAVVSSNTSAMPEVLGDCAIYADPRDIGAGVSALFQALFEAHEGAEFREQRRKQAQQFSWNSTGEKTVAVYEAYAKQLGSKICASPMVAPAERGG